MAIEIIGIFTHRDSAENRPASMGTFELPFLRDLVQAYDRNGYDRILIANAATWPDSIPFAAYIAGITRKLGFMIAHRPGFVAPTMAARMLATIDQLSEGRAAVHIITGANDREMEADGDFLTKERRYARSGEYVDILRRVWNSDTPFDHAGEFYRFNGGFSALKTVQSPNIPVYWGGTSLESLVEAGRCADVYATGVDTQERVGALIDKVRAEGARHGRVLRYCMSLRLLVGETEAQAWEKAENLLQEVTAHATTIVGSAIDPRPSGRFQELASLDSCLDTRLWTAMTKVTKGTKAMTCLVGTAEQIVDELMKYYDLGVTSFLISGFDFVKDPDMLGRGVIPLLRERAAARERETQKAGS